MVARAADVASKPVWFYYSKTARSSKIRQTRAAHASCHHGTDGYFMGISTSFRAMMDAVSARASI